MKNVSNTDANVALVQNIYAAFFRGDMATLIGSLAPDIDWEVMWPEQRTSRSSGRARAQTRSPQFFADVGQTMDVQ